ncbi:FHA domain-containing protein [Bifidobacterium aquikefiri]|uniref:FHA domain-containing protein n=1 Tax=Bifidobacterium aquikefiri TaxID=1653207 RepID=A0A261GAP0_9BIFI|nr:FHA domain-containing protein [Bifidobacterium aquikefiri]OZG68501.1 FHA domain-containing protein [Bifidobacterium aquikefiri]
MTELTFAFLKYGFLIVLWVFAWLAVRSLRQDIQSFSPTTSRARRKRARAANRSTARAQRSTTQPKASNTPAQDEDPTLLVVIDGPTAGVSIPLSHQAITLGRAASNTMVLEDEFVSSHHARIFQDPSSGTWIIEDLGSTNGTVVDGQRISEPVSLPARVPVRIGATTFELR